MQGRQAYPQGIRHRPGAPPTRANPPFRPREASTTRAPPTGLRLSGKRLGTGLPVLFLEMHSPISGQDLVDIGFPPGPAIGAALRIAGESLKDLPREDILKVFSELLASPPSGLGDEALAPLAALLTPPPAAAAFDAALRPAGVPFEVYGRQYIDQAAIDQMALAARLPVAVRGALMPDAHVGYGLPIGGVLATEGAVIPYGVGVDIGCRMALSVFDLPASELSHRRDTYVRILREHTVFGPARDYANTEDHPVLHDDRFRSIGYLKALQATAERQLGTSGGGNHFVEFGRAELSAGLLEGLPQPVRAKGYLALLSHSGSRGLGASVARYFTRLAMDTCRLPPEARHLAWLRLDRPEGQDYWAAMELAGDYASACHVVIHRRVARAMGREPLLRIENHHNFAWKERVGDQERIIHRKGAVPADNGQLGIIPGSMAEPGYIVRGKGEPMALHSAAHGAGRRMSRAQALRSLDRRTMDERLKAAGITLLGGDLDEAPAAYKPIKAVMEAQRELVDVVGTFHPLIVRME
jgi:tRNA-splicing ligase RtcB